VADEIKVLLIEDDDAAAEMYRLRKADTTPSSLSATVERVTGPRALPSA
jgi:hypothetical protein